MRHSRIMQKVCAVVLVLNAVFQASAEKLFPTEKAGLEAQLKTQDLPLNQALGNESLAAELERILEETVDEALFLQRDLRRSLKKKAGAFLKAAHSGEKQPFASLQLF